MTRTESILIVANRLAAGAVDADVAEQQIGLMKSQDWKAVGWERIVLDLALHAVRAEARAAAAERRQRTGAGN